MNLALTPDSVLDAADRFHFERRGEKVLVLAPRTAGYLVLDPAIEADRSCLEVIDRVLSAPGEFRASGLEGVPGAAAATARLVQRGLLSLDRQVLGTSGTRERGEAERVLSPKSALNRYPVLCIFHVHNYCNLACKYCYTIEPGIRRQKLGVESMKKAVDQMVALPTPQTTFEFHGGEPTMAFKEIMEVVAYAREVYARAGKRVGFSIQTNAFSMNPAIVAFLKEHQFSVRVSLDGTEETHNAFRVTRGNRGSYAEVARGLKLLVAAGLRPNAVCVVHRGNLSRMIEMYDSMAALGVAGIRLLPVFQSGNATQDDWVDGASYFEAYFGLIRHMAAKAERGEPVVPLPNLTAGEINAVRSFQRAYMCMRTPCGAGTSMLAIDVNGDLYPCEEMIGKEELVIGNVDRDPIREALDGHPVMQTLKSRHVDEIEECRACPWKQMCHGGCVHKSYTHFKRLDAKSEFCPYFKRVYRELIWLEADRPGTLDRLARATA